MKNNLVKPLRILLVDTMEEDFRLLKKDLSLARRFQSKLDWADSKERALTVYKKKNYDICLVDQQIGKANGLTLVRELARQKSDIPVIVLSDRSTEEMESAAQRAGAADLLLKDKMNPSSLERTILHAIEQTTFRTELDRCNQERTQALTQEIRERKLAQEITLASEARFRALTETTSAAIFIVRDMEIRYANPAAKAVTGYTPAELVAGKFLELIHPDYRINLKQNGLGNPYVPDLPSRFELKINHKDGTTRWLDLTTGPVVYEDKPAWIVTAFDITERENAEQALRKARTELEERISERTAELSQANRNLQAAVEESRKRTDELDALGTATSALLTTLDLETLLGNVLQAACSAIPAAEKAVLEMIAPESSQLQISATSGFKDPHFRSVQLQKSRGYPAVAIRSKKPILVKDVLTDPASASANRRGREMQSARSLIVAPLLFESEALGALLLTSSKPGVFSERDQNLLQSFANTAALAIHNAKLHQDVQRLAVTDVLTGAFNRRGFLDNCRRELERLHRYGHPMSMIYLDIDKFKSINDLNGHEAGDQVLQAVVERSRRHLRQVDLIGRIGGDEFAILLPETVLETAYDIAERICQAVSAEAIQAKQKEIPITVTLGVTEGHPKMAGLEELLSNADKALYKAKHNGGNQVDKLTPEE